ncbi:MAG: hypothetical protein QOE66_334 [Chloroflexota bacterium]|jgi:hypothetical protein|nr:hypothetical protein [Chloroflexota bacterium]
MSDGTGAIRRFDGLRARPSRVLVWIVGLALLGATAFGLWHLVVGGVIDGNWRAGTFGVGLALTAGVPLLLGAWILRRRRRRGRSRAAQP